MNPTTAITVIQGIASKKLMMVLWVIYFLTGLAEKQPADSRLCVGVIAGLAGCFLVCQTVLDWRFGGVMKDKKADCPEAGDTVATDLTKNL
jgi:hypothetical protein